MDAMLYVERAIATFDDDPPATDFQTGYLQALKEARDGLRAQSATDAALKDSAQILLGMADVPIAQADELMAAVQGPAVRAAIEARVEQIVKHGHDREYDSMLAIGHLPRVARGLILDAMDLIDGTVERRNLPVAMRRLARASAVCMAAIDRLEMVKGVR